jgi:serine/threonine protein kinase
MPATNELLQEGRYRIQTASHSGDEKVFEAYDTVRNANVVVREIPVKLNRVSTVSQRESLQLEFANHAKALTEIEHESLVHVHDFFSEIDRQYLVTEAVEGPSLGETLAGNQTPFSVDEVMRWADELLDGLNYLHTRKPPIIHRNINPSNLKLDPTGKVKLVGVGLDAGNDSDFATAYHAEGDLRYSPLEQIWPGLDAASQKAITNHYDDRAERILKQPLDERSDIYSLGATLYYLITGAEPVDPIERSIEILEGKLDPLREPSSVDSRIPPEISDVLMKALEIKRENRYDAAVIMRQVLKTVLTRIREREDGVDTASAEQHISAAPTPEPTAELIEQQRHDAEAELRRQNEQRALMDRQLLQAEEERERTQIAAAEAAERERAEKEAADIAASTVSGDAAESAAHTSLQPEAEVVAYRDTTEVDEDELAAVLRQLEEAEAESATIRTKDVAEQQLEEHVSPVDLAPTSASETPSLDSDVDDIFTIPESTGSKLPLPAIAGALVLVAAIAVGGWFVMSGSDDAKQQEPVSTLQSSQAPQAPQPTPAPVEAAPESVSSTQPTVETPPPSETVAGPPQQAAATRTAAAKPKKAEPAKKKVTVDDLINDN